MTICPGMPVRSPICEGWQNNATFCRKSFAPLDVVEGQNASPLSCMRLVFDVLILMGGQHVSLETRSGAKVRITSGRRSFDFIKTLRG